MQGDRRMDKRSHKEQVIEIDIKQLCLYMCNNLTSAIL